MPVKPLPTGHYGLGHIIESLASSAQSVWWNSMVTRPEIRLVAFESSSRAVGRGRCFQLLSGLGSAFTRLGDGNPTPSSDGWDFQSNGPSCQIAREI